MQVLRPYVFFGISTELEDWRKITQKSCSGNCGITVYGNPDVNVILVQHDSHLEPIISLASSLGRAFNFQATYFGCEAKIAASKSVEPNSFNLMFVPRQRVSDLLEVQWMNLFWRVFRVLGQNLILAYSNEQAREQTFAFDSLREISKRQILGLSRVTAYDGAPVRGRKRRYNPLKARARELKYQLLHAQSYAKDEAANVRHLIRTENQQGLPLFSHRVQLIHQLLKAEIERIGDALKTLKSDSVSVENMVRALNEFESITNILKSAHYISRTTYELDRHLLESDEIFKVEDAFGFEAYSSLGLTGFCPIVIPGRSHYCRVTKTANNIRVIELPLTVGPRLGLLPILYHLVSHFFVEQMVKDFPAKLKRLAAEQEEIPSLCKVRKKYAPERDETGVVVALEEIISDLIAAKIAGPAYFYALPRAFPFEPTLMEKQHVTLGDRLSILRMFLEDRGFQLSLHSPPATGGHAHKTSVAKDGFVLALLRLVSDLELPYEYSSDIQESALEEARTALMLGNVSPLKPSLVSNALWRAVVEKKGYLNENAAFLSVLEWSESTEIYEPLLSSNLSTSP